MGTTESEVQKRGVTPPEVLGYWLKETGPSKLFDRLQAKVLGQDEELRKAAILIHGYLRGIANNQSSTKLHFLIEGKSGCGKTTFAQTLAEVLPCPVITVDSSQLTPAGYKGAEAADFVSSEELENWWGCGVVILDELDKVMEPLPNDGNFRRQGMENLLKMLDGGSVVDRNGKTIDCRRMLFIGMGAFSQLKGKQPEKHPIGFAPTATTLTTTEPTVELSKETMSDFCGSEQFLGRFVTVLHFKPLGRDLYMKIIERTRFEIMKLFGDCPMTLEEAEEIIDRAMGSEFGCRSIRSAVWENFLGTDTVIRKLPDARRKHIDMLETEGDYHPCA